ncbi:MAG: hypothetical protein PVG91_04285 [Gammaproteobacteria bacterium]
MEDLCAYAEYEAQAERFDFDWNKAAEEHESTLRAVKGRLMVSEDPEHLHTAAMLEDDPTRRMDLMARAVSAGGDNPFHVWSAVRMCAELHEETDCPLQAWQERMLELDGQNSEAWILAAAVRMQAGAGGAALDAMHRAAASSESRLYWPETIEMTERAFAAASDLPFRDRVGLGADFASLNLPNYLRYVTMCQEQSEQSQDWALACLRYGEVSEREGKTVIGQRIALVIQRIASKSLGDEARRQAAAERYEQVQRVMNEASVDSHETMMMVTSSPTLFARYLASFRTVGEIETMASMHEEAGRWARRHQDLECIP